MMNLLISIIGDTFGRVSIEQVEADARSLAELILEVENMFYWKRDSG